MRLKVMYYLSQVKYLCKDNDEMKIPWALLQRARVGVSLVDTNNVESFSEFPGRLIGGLDGS